MASPTNTDVTSYLSERYGVTVSGTGSIDDLIASAIEELQAVTGYRPFVSSTQSSHRVWVRGSRVRLPNAIITLGEVTSDGQTFTQGTHFELGPLSGPRIEWLEWLVHYPAKPVTIDAIFGHSTDYPADVWLAIVQLVAARVIDGLLTGKIADSGVSWSDGDVSESYGAVVTSGGKGEAGSVASGEIDRAMTTFKRHRRTVGFA